MIDVELSIEETRKLDRPAIPAQASVPLAPGQLHDATSLALLDGTTPLPLQATVLSRWPANRSVKWLLLDFLINLAPSERKTLRLRDGAAGGEAWALPGAADLRPLAVRTSATEVGIDTGPLQLTVPGDCARLLRDVRCRGQVSPLGAVELSHCDATGRRFAAADDDVRLAVEAAGPVRAVVRVDGAYRDAGGARCMRYRVRLIAWAGQCVVRLQHAFIHGEADPLLELGEVSLKLRSEGARVWSGPKAVDAGWRMTAGEDNRLREWDGGGRLLSAAPTRVDPPPAAVGDDACGVVVHLKDFKPQFPKAYRAATDGLHVDLWPAGRTLRYHRGMGKMHEIDVGFYSPACDRAAMAARLAGHVDLPRAAATPAHVAGAGAVPGVFAAGRRGEYPRIEMAIKDVFINRDVFVGMLDYGDDVGWGYTHAGRGGFFDDGPWQGRKQPIWNNHEYDLPGVALHQYLRSGEDYYFEQGRVAVLHMMHVDYLHAHDGPPPLPGCADQSRGGVALHVPEHTRNGAWAPCHTWVGGLVWHHLLTGCAEAREKARAIGDSLHAWARSPRALETMHNPRRLSREYGWPLVALCELHDAFAEPADLEHAAILVEYLTRWEAAKPTLCDNGFCIAVCLSGLARFHQRSGDAAAGALFHRLLATLVDQFTLPEGLTSINRTETRANCYGRRWGHGIMAAEAYAYAWSLTGEERYLRRGLRELAYLLDSGLFRNYVFQASLHVGVRDNFHGAVCDRTDLRPVTGREIAQHLRHLFPLLDAAHDAGLLRAIDYPPASDAAPAAGRT